MASDGVTPAVTGDDVRRAREARKLTRAQLADQIGSSEGTIKQIEMRGSSAINLSSRFAPPLLGLLGLADSGGEPLLTADVIERALRQADDVALIAETARRMAYARADRHDQRNVRAFEIRGMPERDSNSRDSRTPPA